MNIYLLLIIISGICGGSVYPLIKIAESYSIPNLAYIFWESLIITILLILISLCTGTKKLLKKSELKYYFFCAFTNIIIPQILAFIIAPNLSASLISIIIVLTPIFVYLSTIVFFKEKFIRYKAFGIVIGFIGAALLFLPALKITGNQFQWYWVILAVLLPIDYAFNRVFATKLLPKTSSSYSLAIGLFSIATLISGVLMLITRQTYIPFQSFHYGDLALLTHAILMSIFYIIFFVLAKKSAIQNSLSFYITPIVGTSWGVLFFGETIGMIYIASILLVFSGLYLVNRK